ncbi:hypothetical protein DS2_17973 [Catenovulum agarivorans DS-2]|uniref:Uncharacterized protein n=1 Tax=Catenovulum agarivorans DS-2 TaxID=1328313 RepID=W7QH72_9ALTE|nr:DUF4824 family protein [Catenovulum agarivorans]EWH08312.1 hypothetical protein DS2_17973 [Catenovulum agarivorans DS-2]
MRKHILLASVAFIILVVNAVVLGKVWYNQSNPLYSVVLTERELTLPYSTNKENSGISLSFDVKIPHEKNKYTPTWLTTEKIAALELSNNSSKELYIALELNGDTHQLKLSEAELKYQNTLDDPTSTDSKRKNALRIRDHLKYSASRLYAINAATNFSELADKYAKQSNVFIAKGVVRSYQTYSDKSEGESDKIAANLNRLSVDSIFIPYPRNQQLKNLNYRNRHRSKEKPRYKVELTYGANLEPVVGKVSLL